MLAFTISLFFISLVFSQPKIVVENPWIREVPPVSTMSAMFMTLKNEGNEEDFLIGVETDISRIAEIHTTIMEEGMMKMRRIEKVRIPPNGKVEFKPMGKHIMLIDLKRPIREGEKVNVILIFEKSGRIELEVPVKRKMGMHMMHH